MNTRSGKSSHVEHVPAAAAISRIWRADCSISESSARLYLQWIARFRRYCGELGLVEADELTHLGAGRFKTWCVRSADRRALCRTCTCVCRAGRIAFSA